jgi:DNA-binding phage protein
MSKRMKVADLPEFDAAPYLDSEASIAAYLTDILDFAPIRSRQLP